VNHLHRSAVGNERALASSSSLLIFKKTKSLMGVDSWSSDWKKNKKRVSATYIREGISITYIREGININI
jgi:hypothetical protein